VSTGTHLLEPFIRQLLVSDRCPNRGLHSTSNTLNSAFDIAGELAGGASGGVGARVRRGYNIARRVSSSGRGVRHCWVSARVEERGDLATKTGLAGYQITLQLQESSGLV
jgi:hypothetical protein